MGSSGPMIILEEKETSTNRQNSKLKISFPLNRRSVSQLCPAFLWAVRGQCNLAGSAVTSLATQKTGTVFTPKQMSEIAGHDRVTCISKCIRGSTQFTQATDLLGLSLTTQACRKAHSQFFSPVRR